MNPLGAIARALGGEVVGNQVLAPGPGHDKRDRSLSIKLSVFAPDGFIVFSHCGDDWRACHEYVRARLGAALEANDSAVITGFEIVSESERWAPEDVGRLAPDLRLPVFPCLETKAPACPGGFKAAARSRAALLDLWRRYPGPLVGVATGEVSGIDVLDVDPKNGGRDWYEAHRERLPSTRIHRTRSGGLHLLFRHLSGLRNSAGKIATGVDVRADGGYVIWWPMERLKATGFLDALAEWPTWLLPSLMSPPVPPPPPAPRPITDRAIEGVLRTVATAPEGQRNALTYWAAHRLRESVRKGEINEGPAREILLEAAQQAGLPSVEAGRTIASAMRSGPRG